ncbi:MAG: DUF5723 family protein [Cytophagales bacterium]|nr:DUF5723 family protein [Cytophagales bacterium]
MVKKYLLFITLVCFINKYATSQAEFTLGTMEHVFQSTYMNGMAQPDNTFGFGLPGISSIYVGYANTGFNYANITLDSTHSDGTTKKYFSFRKLSDAFASGPHFVSLNQNIDILHAWVKMRSFHLSFNVSQRGFGIINFPADFSRLVYGGTIDENGVGKDLNLSGFGANMTAYNEYVLGISRKGRRMMYSARVKFLQGIANLDVYSDDFFLNVDKDMYDLSFKFNGTARMSNPFIRYDDNAKAYKNVDNPEFGFNNRGFGGDIGLGYLFRKNVALMVNANNLGFITWRTNPVEIAFDGEATTFRGVDIAKGLLNGESISAGEFVDSLSSRLTPKTKGGQAYTKWLTPSFYGIFKWEITPRIMLQATLFMQQYFKWRPGFAVSAQVKMARFFSITGSASNQYGVTNFGAGFVFKPGPVQIYFVSDNILAISGAIQTGMESGKKLYIPTDSKTFNFRIGMNFVFGRAKLEQAQAFSLHRKKQHKRYK